MTFEDIIKKLSAIAAAFFVFFIAAGIYLSLKGFGFVDGNITLIRNAEAADKTTHATMASNIVIPGGRSMGSKTAPVTIYEYSSLGCFHCADFHLEVLPQIKSEYVDKGKVRVVFSNFPLDQRSLKAAMLASCMPDDKYFDFISLLFKKQREWSLSLNAEKTLAKYAALNGLSEDKAYACMKDADKAQELVNARQQAMQTIKVQGTPTFVVANRNSREILNGFVKFEEIKPVIDQKLN